jgi:hypothetical protein
LNGLEGDLFLNTETFLFTLQRIPIPNGNALHIAFSPTANTLGTPRRFGSGHTLHVVFLTKRTRNHFKVKKLHSASKTVVFFALAGGYGHDGKEGAFDFLTDDFTL